MPEQLKSGGQGSTIGVPGSADSYKQIERPIRSSTPTASTATPSGPGTGRVATPTEVHEIQFKERMQPVDTNTIRQQAVAELDGQIKAIQQQAAEQVREEQQAGQEREGRTRAIQARRGLVGSDFGDAQTTQTKQFTQKNIDLINQQKNVQIAAVFDKIDQRAQERIEAEKNRVLKAEDEYFAYLQTKKEEAKEDVKTLASTGITLQQLDPADKQDLMEQTGYDNELMFDLYYNSNLPQADRIEWKSEKLADGSIMFWGQDPVTGQIKQQKAEFDVAPMEDIVEFNGVVYGSRRDVDGNIVLRQLTVKDTKSDLTTAQKDYQFAVSQGYGGSFADWVKKGDGTSTRTITTSDGEVIEIGSKQLSPTQANLLSEGKQLSFVLEPLYEIIDTKPGLFGPVRGFLGQKNSYDTEAQTIDDDLRRASQVIGKYMEGGVLRKEDEEKYRKMLPQLTDKPEVALNKLEGVANLLAQKQQDYLESYAKAGYDVSKFVSNNSDTSATDMITNAKSEGYSDNEIVEFLKNDNNYSEQVNTAKEAGYSDQEIIEFLKGNDLSRSENYSSVDKIAQAIGQYESGGNYQARGPVVTSGQYKGERALGKYQIMPGNLPSWSMAALGREVSEQEFLNSPEIQDSIAHYKMNEIYKKYGTVEDVASVWFSGQPVARAGNAKDVLGTSVPKYVKNIVSIHNRLS